MRGEETPNGWRVRRSLLPGGACADFGETGGVRGAKDGVRKRYLRNTAELAGNSYKQPSRMHRLKVKECDSHWSLALAEQVGNLLGGWQINSKRSRLGPFDRYACVELIYS